MSAVLNEYVTLWAQALGVTLLAGGALVLGRCLARRRKAVWAGGYALGMVLVVVVAVLQQVPRLAITCPLGWLVAGRRELVRLAVAAPVVLAIPYSQTPRRLLRLLLVVFATPLVCHQCVLPFLLPALTYDGFAALETTIDRDGVCLQNTGYTCGPAAAVTALRELGVESKEGDLAIAARTTVLSGTPPDLLCMAIESRHGASGVACSYRCFSSLSDLRAGGVALVLVNLDIGIDHYVAVLQVTDDEVVVADPLTGRTRMLRAEFRRVWRRRGIVVRRDAAV